MRELSLMILKKKMIHSGAKSGANLSLRGTGGNKLAPGPKMTGGWLAEYLSMRYYEGNHEYL